jgi:hypothetical protein
MALWSNSQNIPTPSSSLTKAEPGPFDVELSVYQEASFTIKEASPLIEFTSDVNYIQSGSFILQLLVQDVNYAIYNDPFDINFINININRLSTLSPTPNLFVTNINYGTKHPEFDSN